MCVLCFCLCVCWCVCLSFCLSGCLSGCMRMCACMLRRCVCVSVNLSVCSSVCLVLFAGIAFRNVGGAKAGEQPPPLFPCVGLQTKGAEVETNFGQRPFQFDLESYKGVNSQRPVASFRYTAIELHRYCLHCRSRLSLSFSPTLSLASSPTVGVGPSLFLIPLRDTTHVGAGLPRCFSGTSATGT